jgi:23S rRNA pseudouridine2605 synthase
MNQESEEVMAEGQEGERLARFLAHAGVASRRHAEALIAAGRVHVNGVAVTTQGTRIDPAHDSITVDGKPVIAPVQHVYILLHKPTGYVTTTSDPQGRPTVLELLPEQLRHLRVYPVGRLDIDTSGLLLLTNDGDFALHITHPRYSLEKHYHALVHGCPTPRELAMLRSGVEFTEDNGQHHTSALAKVRIVRQEGERCWLSLLIHEGRKRQVRRMLFAVGHRVFELKRVGIGSVELGNLPVGKWRYLDPEEVEELLGNVSRKR